MRFFFKIIGNFLLLGWGDVQYKWNPSKLALATVQVCGPPGLCEILYK